MYLTVYYRATAKHTNGIAVEILSVCLFVCPSVCLSNACIVALRTTKFSPKKLETLLCRTVFTYLQTIISFCHNTGEYRLEVAVFEGSGSLGPIFQVEGDVSHQPFVRGQIGQRMPYNFAAESFHTKKLCSRLFSRKAQFLCGK